MKDVLKPFYESINHCATCNSSKCSFSMFADWSEDEDSSEACANSSDEERGENESTDDERECLL